MKVVLCMLVLASTLAPCADEPTAAAREAAVVIRREALWPPNGPAGRPLPLVSHWNVGAVKGTFGPDHQIGLLQAGHYVLPWLAWPQWRPDSDAFKAYHERLLTYFAKLELPISFRGTQWNAVLVSKEYLEGPESNWAGVISPDGKRQRKVSAFGPLAPWRDPARIYVATPAMKRIQELYPNPPLVLWVSNNEPPDLRWAKHGPLEAQSKRYLDTYGEGHDDEFKRRVIGEGWIERYNVMFAAMRAALVSEDWQRNVRFVGYEAFGPPHFGRWDGWLVYSLITDQWTCPDWFYWQGGSPSYYTHNWNDNRDHWVFSAQVQSMNLVQMLTEAWQANPEFWFEISTWDGNHVKEWAAALHVDDGVGLLAKSSRPLAIADRAALDPKQVAQAKVLQYMKEGQDYPPARTAGWVQFGMWLLRPRAVREFRASTTQLEMVEPYWLETVKAVDRVHREPILTEFWRHGNLVPNLAHRHPYQAAIPAKYRDQHRWYLLDTNLDPPRPWTQQTDLPVFSLALVLGEPGSRRWLLFAHAPLADRAAVVIRIPDYREVTVDVPRRGSFHELTELDGQVRRVGAD